MALKWPAFAATVAAMRMQLQLALAAAVLFVPGALAAARAAPDLDSAARYRDCLRLVETDPDAAYDRSEMWRLEGGGPAARHCGALALVALELYGEAALRLGDLADAPGAGGTADRAAILAQAGNAWLLAGAPQNAVAALDAAIALLPDDPDLLIDRARARAGAGDPEAAASDLTRALAVQPDSTIALVLRAGAHRAAGRLEPALADADRALALSPDLPDALVERGAIRLALGDEAGARADWVRVGEIAGSVAPDHPDAAALEAARRALESLDLDAG